MTPHYTAVTGVQQVVNRLRRHADATDRGIERGVVRAALFLQRESQLIVPVDTGNLKNSAATRKQGNGWRTVAQVMYLSPYGLFVHEDLEARHKEGKEAKFLEKPARTKGSQMVRIVRDSIIGSTI